MVWSAPLWTHGATASCKEKQEEFVLKLVLRGNKNAKVLWGNTKHLKNMFPTTTSLKVLGTYRAPDGWGALQWSTASLSPSMHLYSLCGDSSGKRTGSSTSTTCFFRCGTSWCSQSIAAVNTWYSSSIRSSSLRSSFTSCSLDKLENSSEAHTWPQTRMQRFTKHWIMKTKGESHFSVLPLPLRLTPSPCPSKPSGKR